MTGPNYIKIYTDMISMKFPDKLEPCKSILDKDKFSTIDVIKIQKILFGEKDNSLRQINQRFNSYDQSTVLNILKYQAHHGLNNSQIAKHFNLSRNTIAKWREKFLISSSVK